MIRQQPLFRRIYYFIGMYLSGNVKIIDDGKSGLSYLIKSFEKNKFPIDQYYAISSIINNLLILPIYANVLITIENKMINNNLDETTKDILKIIEDDFNTFFPLLLPKLFSKFYDNSKKGFDVWGTQVGFNIHTINHIDEGSTPKKLFNSISRSP